MHHWPPRLELAASNGLTWGHAHSSIHKETRPNPNTLSVPAPGNWQLKGHPCWGTPPVPRLSERRGGRYRAQCAGAPARSKQRGWATSRSLAAAALALRVAQTRGQCCPPNRHGPFHLDLHTAVNAPGDAPTPRLPNHCPVKGPELNYLGTPSSRLSCRDSVESLQRDYPDIIAHASSPE